MKSIDLFDYTHSKENIPTEFLSPQAPQREIENWKILASHAVDFYVILVTSSFFSSIYSFGIKSLLVTRSLQISHEKINYATPLLYCLPFITLGYYFFSYFFNDGQSFGQKIFKSRISLKHKNFESAFTWSLFSTFLILSCGLILLRMKKGLREKGWGSFEAHDHLYHQLMLDRVLYPIDLVKEVSADIVPFPVKKSEEELAA